MISITREHVIAAAHRLFDYCGRCERLHGHNYRIRVTLTAKGKEHAREITRRHETLRGFLRDFLEVEPTLADETACKMEHILSPEIIQKFARLASFVQSIPCGNKQWLFSDRKPACGQCEICNENECQGKAQNAGN